MAAVVLSALLLLTQIHTSELSKESADLNSANSELAYVNAQNRQLSAEVGLLRQMPYVEHLARIEYGLISKGQKEYSIIFPGNTESTAGITRPKISSGQLVEGDSSALVGSPFLPNQTVGSGKSKSKSVLQRMLGEVEFWKWAF
ncbi:MAG: septum formation initiator family protein [Firmicutes bacterium]|nr:septum formation initiator family protein [Bacillota bacterium]